MSQENEIILHHYDMSPFSEKIRKILAHKDLDWHAVQQPMWLPRPCLTPMTGAYRRIPVLQIGAEIYCDTRLIARKIEQLHPEPSIYPQPLQAAGEVFAQWVDRHMFQTVVPQVFAGLAAALPPELLEDRRKMRPDLDPEQLMAVVPHARDELRAFLASIEPSLAGNDYVLGDSFSIADAALYHLLWFARNEPNAAAMIGRFPGLSAWLARMDTSGWGRPQDMEPEAALDIARRAEPQTESREDRDDPAGLRPGMDVAVCSDDLPGDIVSGKVVASDADEIVILRESDECGALVQHFPRAGYQVRSA